MKKPFLSILFFCLTFFSYSQLDYHQMKDTICPSKGFCGFRDSADLSSIYPKLLNIDTNMLSKGLAEYYGDLWEVEYELFAHRGADTVFLRRSTNSAVKALYHDPKDSRMMWNSAIGYNFLGECDKAIPYLLQYAKFCPRKFWDKEQIGYFLKNCPNEEVRKRLKIAPAK